ncbi:MAG TPA: zinc ribbon domain-containing protein [Gemmatimonadales bacterium]|nr:zinc ribbon domain-containing protein [Gemmatimonadales bacterium]
MNPPTPCPRCGASADGKFCAQCGLSLAPGTCAACQASLTPGAQYCHRCGTPVGTAATPGTLRSPGPWIFAGALTLVMLGWVVWRVNRGVEPAPPPAGQAAADAPFVSDGGTGGTPPDLSQIAPRDAFLRLHDRVMGALEQGDTATATQFAPMAIQAYGMLTGADRDLDVRYHAATLMLGSGDLAAAQVLTDSLARENPGHLFVDMLRAGLAEAREDRPAARTAYRRFLTDYDRQLATRRPEYQEHLPLLEAFKERAQAQGR